MLELLGIHWGQFPERWELRNGAPAEESRRDLITEGAYVQGMSGMTCVIPAWHIREVLDMPKLRELRQAATATDDNGAPVAEGAHAPGADNPNQREDFTRL
jgi:hypothetical protein